MSTNWGYVCKSHEPNITSTMWLNHGEEILETVFVLERNGLWPNEPDVNFPSDQWDPVDVPYLDENWPVCWLREHPNCVIALKNEYGIEVSLPQKWGVAPMIAAYTSQVERLQFLINFMEEKLG